MSPDAAANPLDACLENLDELSDILMQWLDAVVTLTPSDPEPYNAEEPNAILAQGPWFGLAMGSGEKGLLAVISESVLPSGALEPDDSQYRGLVEVARGVAQVIAPEAADAGQFRPGTLADLAAEITKAEPSEATQVLRISLSCDDGGEGKEGTLLLIGPVAKALSLIPERVLEPSPPPEQKPPETVNPVPAAPAPAANRPPIFSALMKIPVPVTVTLADKKMPLGQILDLGPGMIIQFDKSCEDLIDLNVNRQMIGKGEAMKVGEKFGIKITEIYSPEERAALLAKSFGRPISSE